MKPQTSLYWNVIAPVARRFISKRHGYELGRKAYAGGRAAYRELIAAAPDLGENNPMCPTFLQSMVFVALWKAAEGALSPDDMQLVTQDVLSIAPLALVGLVRDARKSSAVLDSLLADMHANEQWAQEHEGSYESAWRIAFDEKRHEDGVFYEFTRCPIQEFCREQGIEEITPVLCDIDLLTTRLIHSRLIREHTLAADGPSCDYWIVPEDIEEPR